MLILIRIKSVWIRNPDDPEPGEVEMTNKRKGKENLYSEGLVVLS
jgi:hypothetical protein